MDSRFNRYSQRNFSGVLFLGGWALLVFVPVHWRGGDQLTAALIIALVLALWGLAAWAWMVRRIGAYPVMIITGLCNFGGLLVLLRLHEIGIFWLYPLLMAIAYVMPWRWSIPINITNVLVALFFTASWMADPLYFRLIATLLVALTFSALFAYNIEQQQEMLKDLAVHDPLTGAFNRRYFDQVLDEARRHWQRTGRVASMLMIDIDHFKLINDTHGHRVGDTVLVALSRYITAQLRPMDRFFRLGGEEFAILLPETPALQGATLAERIRQRIAAGSLEGGLPVFTISCGVAEYPEPATASDWPDQCDAALYAAKAAGRNQVVLADHVGKNEASFAE